jgi:prepilin-type N-terminal cleavage/methylation domain-containing protein
MNTRGFTILEVLIAMFLLAIVTSIIYASFATVVDAELMRTEYAQELRDRQALSRHFRESIGSAFADENEFLFIGEDFNGKDGPEDSLQFISTAPVSGPTAMPGDLKVVVYELLGVRELDEDTVVDPDALEEEAENPMLNASETPLSTPELLEEEGQSSDLFDEPFGEEEEERQAGFTYRDVESLDFQYFDGVEWVDAWAYEDYLRLPWAVHVRLNFVKSKEERDAEKSAGIDKDESPDFEVVVTIPRDMGKLEELQPQQALDES